MSKTIDERVVEMRFDNKQFESNVQTSLSTLDKLKRSLNMDGAAKGLESVSAAASNCNMSGLRSAVETVHAKFSAFEVMAVTALANITNSAINAGKQMLKSLTIDPVSQGFEEYELKMGSIQTIMASTGESLETVNQYLNELNTYADRTIYSFSDMTTNIGKFTNAGVKLEDAVKAIQGISNEAAVSGANANEASRAMYNFAQALSAGYVKLIDWKSIENANMATVEFKNQLLETALAMGTVVKVGDKYQTTTTDAKGKVSDLFDATHNFNDALSAQWMTTDVLVKTLGDYADETTEIGKKAFAAAQDVKTFTQLMDTLKEAAGSGWAATWEIVFGNFEEAKELWTSVSTVVGGFIDAQSEARNSLLQGWKDLGGRAKLIEAFKNAFEGLVSVIKPVGEAFREIFPKTTAEQLYSITKSLSNFAARLKLSDTASTNLKNTFKGLFSILSIVKQAFSAVLKAISPLFGGLNTLGGGILGVTGKFGAWLAKIDESIKKNDTFTKAIQGVISFLQLIPKKINAIFQSITGSSIGEAFDWIRKKAGDFLDKMKEIFSGFGKIDTKGIDTLTDKTTTAFTPLTTLFDGIKKVFSGIWEFLKKLAPIFTSIANAAGKALGGIGMSISKALKNADFEKILELVNGGVLVAIGVGIKKFVDSLTSVTKNAAGFVDSLKGILDGVKGSFEAWQKDIKANALLKIAGAVGILTLSLVVLSGIEASKLYDALASITTLFVELAATMLAMSKIGSVSVKNSVSMIAMSAAILVLASALKKLSGLDMGEITSGLIGIAGLSAILVIVAKQLSKNSGKLIKGAVGLIAFAAAIRLLVKPVKELGSLDIGSLAKGLVGIGVLCAELVLFLKTADLDKMSLGKGLGLMALAESINILAKAVSKFAALDTTALIKGLAGVGVVLAEIAAFMKLTNNSKGLMSTAIGMTVLGAAMLIFGKAIANIGSLSWESIAKGLVGIGAALLGVAAAMKLMPDGAKMIAAGAGMVLVGASMKIFASAISSMSTMSWGELAKGLTAMALALAEVVIAMKLMDGKALAGASAVLVCAAALGLFVPVLKALGGMSWGEIAKGLLTVAGVFTILGAAGYILKPVVGTILALSAAMALIGVAAVAFGAGLLAVSVALSAFAGSAAILVAAIVDILIGLVTAIPDIVAALAKSLGEALPAIIECIVAVAKAALLALNEVVPLAVEVLLNIVQEVLASLAAHIQGIVESLLQIVVGILEGLAAGIPQVIASAIKLFKAILDAIFDALGGFDIGTILTATAALTALAAMMTLITLIAAEAVIATAVLPIIGMNLNKFIENAQPFLAEIQKVDAASLQGAKNLAETVLMLTAAGIMDALTSWFTGGKSFIKFGEQLAEFAPYLKQYYLGIKGIDAGVVEASANAAKALGEMAANLPNSGGLAALIAGDNSLASFAEELTVFGPKLKAYADSVKGLDAQVVINSSNAALAMAELAKKLPNSGGLAAVFAGDNSLAAFAEELTVFGPKLKEYANSVDGLKPGIVENSANAAMALAQLADNLPNSGGMVSWFTGDNSLAAFAEELAVFGPKLKAYADSIKGINGELVVNSANAALALAEMASKLPNSGGMVSWFTGDNSLAAFAEELAAFGPELKKYADSIKGLDAQLVTESATAAESLAKLANGLPNSGGVVSWFAGDNSLSDFASELAAFGPELKKYADSVAGLDAQVVINSVNAAQSIAEFAHNLPNSGGLAAVFAGDNTLSQFANELTAFGPSLKAYAESVEGLNSEIVVESANAAMAIANLANNLPNSGGIVSVFTGDNTLSQFATELAAFGPQLKAYADSVSGLDSEVVINSVNAAQALAELASNLPAVGGIGAVFSGDTSLSTFAKELSAFAPAFKSYADSMDGLDMGVVEQSANAAKALAQMATYLPNSGGIASWFSGEQSLSTFADELSAFGPSLKSYADSVSGLNSEVVIESANAAKSLFEIAQNLPEQGGIVSWFTGEQSLASFGAELSKFGPSLKSYADSVEGLKADVVANSANAAKSLFEMASNLPARGGIIDWFTGEQSLSIFANELMDFGPSLKAYADSVDGLKANVVIESANAAKALAEMSTNLPQKGGIADWFTGEQSLSAFAKELTTFGPSLKSYADSIGGLRADVVTNSANAAKSLTELANNLPKKGGWFSNDSTLSDFGKVLAKFGSFFNDYYSSISGINTAILNDVIKSTNSLVEMAKGMSSIDTKGMSNFGDSLKKLGKNSKFKSFAKDMMTHFSDGLKSCNNSIANAVKDIISNAVSAIRNKYNDFKNAGKYLVDGFADGVTANTYLAKAKSVAMAQAALDAAKNILKIKSPSKAFYEVGNYSGIGFVNALGDYASKAYSAGSEMAQFAKNGLSNAISKITDVINDDIDTQPTIRPVLDLTNLVGGADEINRMLYTQRSIQLAANTSTGINGRLANNQNGITLHNEDVVDAIGSLRKDVASLASIISNLKIVMDTGTLVGTLSGPLDAALGKRVVYEERGI